MRGRRFGRGQGLQRIQCGRNGAEGKQHGIAPTNCRKCAANFAAQALLRPGISAVSTSKRRAIAENPTEMRAFATRHDLEASAIDAAEAVFSASRRSCARIAPWRTACYAEKPFGPKRFGNAHGRPIRVTPPRYRAVDSRF